MQSEHEPQPERDIRPFLIGALIIALVIAIVILHLTGVVGPG